MVERLSADLGHLLFHRWGFLVNAGLIVEDSYKEVGGSKRSLFLKHFSKEKQDYVCNNFLLAAVE